jgi:hypothetical protein
MKAAIFSAALSIVTLTSSAWSSEAKSQHGGRVIDTGEYHVEMVTKRDLIEVYLADHSNQSVSTAGHKGLAILAVAGKSQRIELTSSEGSRLSGKAVGELPASPRGVVQITLPTGKTIQARFN